MRFLWLSVAQIDDDNGRLVSAVPSARTRVIGPVNALRALGHRFRIVNPAHSLQRATQLLDEVDVVVFGKPFPAGDTGSYELAYTAYRELLGRLDRRAVRVIIDAGDTFFEAPGFASLYAASKPHEFVAPSGEMARLLRERLAIEAAVIPDSFEGTPRSPARPLPTRTPRLFRLLNRLVPAATGRWRACVLWTGSRMDVDALRAALPDLAAASRWLPLHLLCLGFEGAGLESLPAECRRLEGDLTAELVPASPEAAQRALHACDLVWLPHSVETERARIRGANDLVEAIRAGRFAVTSQLPAYRELAAFAFVGEDCGEGIRWALRNPGAAAERVAKGQQHVLAHFSPDAVGRAWLAAASG